MTFVVYRELLKKRLSDIRWKDSIFREIKEEPSLAVRGLAFQEIVANLLQHHGYLPKGPFDSESDLIIDGNKCEIKVSTVGRKDGYVFNQIRPHQDWEYLILATIHYSDVITLYRISKDDVKKLIDEEIFKPQHGGITGDGQTYICSTRDMVPFQDYMWYIEKAYSEETHKAEPDTKEWTILHEQRAIPTEGV